MARWDNVGLWWQDIPQSSARGERTLGPMPPIPETGWKPPTHYPNIIDAPWISLDTETKDLELNDYGPGWARGKGEIVGISVCTPQGKWYFPVAHTVQSEMNMDSDLTFRWLRYSLAGRQPKIGANLIYDIGWLRQHGVIVNGPLYDIQAAEALLDENALVSLEHLAWKYLRRGKTTDQLKEWIQLYYGSSDAKWRGDIWRSPPSLVGFYAEDDAMLPYEILKCQWRLLVANGLLELFEMECRLTRLLVDMRFQGQSIDLNYAEWLHEDFGRRGKEWQAEVDRIAGMRELNVNSAEQLSRAFDKLGLYYPRTEPTERAPNGNPSFTKEVLTACKHPIAKAIMKTKEIQKMDSTFVQGYMLNSHVNGKIYASFNPLKGDGKGAKTGRFSSSDPNLQNIPVRTEEGKLIRTAFIGDAGHIGVRAYDYSQIEYRMLAHFAVGQGAEELRHRYRTDPKTDFHKLCGELIVYHTKVELARSYIKNINFGLTYGMGLEHLAESLGVSTAEAINLLNAYHTSLPFAKATMKQIGEDVQRDGVCRTLLNRQTHFDLWEPRSFGVKGPALPYGAALAKYGTDITRAYAYRAINYKLQGSAADVMKAAMLKCYEDGIFDATGVPRMTVHDELVFSDPGDISSEAWREMQHAMETCLPQISIPLKAEEAIAVSWGGCK